MFIQHNDPTLDNLPQDLRELTKKQQKALLKFYSSMTLKELRQRQSMAQEQKCMALDLMKKRQGYNIELAYSNLEITEQFIFTVIFKGTYKK